jgi:DNA-binding NarL/FixJ family response regulator
MTPLKTRILIADDHPIVLRGLRIVLNAQPDLEVTTEASDGEQAVTQALSSDAHLAILDISMPRKTEPFLYPDGIRALMREYLERARTGEAHRELLTPREEEILKLVAEAHTNEEIGELLHISKKTVERHRANILEKLGMRDRVQLTRYAIRRGLITA